MEPPQIPKTLPEVLVRAATHPIYASLVRDSGLDVTSGAPSLAKFPFLTKSDLGNGIAYLLASDPTALHDGAHVATTGGTISVSLYFISSCAEHRHQHQLVSIDVLRPLRVFTSTDIVMNLSGGLPMYRSLGVFGELAEYTGAMELPVTSLASDALVVQLSRQFGATAVMGPTSRLLQFARYVNDLRGRGGDGVAIKKIVYTSEPLAPHHERYLAGALRAEVVASLFGSAEVGIWCGAPPSPIVMDGLDMAGDRAGLRRASGRIFVFDRRHVVVEIVSEEGTVLANSTTNDFPVPADEAPAAIGEIVLTSLCRWRNPLVRYRTGDLGSLHPLSALGDPATVLHDCDEARLKELIDHLCIRIYGRRVHSSFNIRGWYVDVTELDRLVFGRPEWGVLEWQVILSALTDEQQAEATKENEGMGAIQDMVEFRVVRERAGGMARDEGDYEERLRTALDEMVFDRYTRLAVRTVEYDELERGRTARKVLKIVDRRP
ncbi:hypothetical protein BDZ91DRAFT_752858 [Kalaharituber pfeilii]|nr:hypothetical protein BDZ91DRAFT_752858 [Kalaharituber pfeilii]